jgi:hypothetical protein
MEALVVIGERRQIARHGCALHKPFARDGFNGFDGSFER